MFAWLKNWKLAFILIPIGALQFSTLLSHVKWSDASLLLSDSLALGMETSTPSIITDLGNIEFKSLAPNAIKVKSQTWLRFQLGSVLPIHPNFLNQYSTPQSIVLTVKANHPDDEIMVLKNHEQPSKPEKATVIFRKKLEFQHWQKLMLPELTRGFYFIKINSTSERSPLQIKLNLIDSKKHADLAGKTTETARKLGANPARFSTEEFLGGHDLIDLYHFSINTPSIINMNLTNIVRGNVLVKLYRAKGGKGITQQAELVHDFVITDTGIEDHLSPNIFFYQGIKIHDKELTFDAILTSDSYWLRLERISGQLKYQLRINTFPAKLSSVARDLRLTYLVERGFLPSSQFSQQVTPGLSLEQPPVYWPLDKAKQPFLDIRGFGDSAYSGNRLPKAPESGFLEALRRFDKNGVFYTGDINIINWESVVAHRCHAYGGQLGFISSPEAIKQAILSGFNVFSVSNNHSRDCDETPESKKLIEDGGGGEISTYMNMTAISKQSPMIWSGISIEKQKQLISTGIFKKGDSNFKIAFSSIDLGRNTCVRSNCYSDRFAIAEAMAREVADIKIVMVHSREWLDERSEDDNLRQLHKINQAMELFIGNYGVDIVYGSGPHSALPVKIIKKKTGGNGVGFWSLGNFIHPNLLAKQHNMIGRVLFDMETRKPVQVQAIMLKSNKKQITAYDFDKTESLTSGVPWEIATDPLTNLSVGYIDLNSIVRFKKQIVTDNNSH